MKGNPGRAIEIGAKIGTAALPKSSNADASKLLDVINFYLPGKKYPGKFVRIFRYLNVHYKVFSISPFRTNYGYGKEVEKKMNVVNNNKRSVNIFREKITYIKDGNKKEQKRTLKNIKC